MSVQTAISHITTTPGIAGGKPHIAGRRLTVQQIVVWHEQMGYSVDEIATQYDLTLSEIYAALAYYYDHKDAIDHSIAESEAFADTLRQKIPSLLIQKLYEQAG
jgi:uncharacterized protein (DUF433 family)